MRVQRNDGLERYDSKDMRPEHVQPAAVLFADDSGNTGPDLMDAVQPYAVTAMLLVGVAAINSLQSQITTIVGKLQQPPKELKFSKVARRAYGPRLLDDIMGLLPNLGVVPFYSVTEKRYLACA